MQKKPEGPGAGEIIRNLRNGKDSEKRKNPRKGPAKSSYVSSTKNGPRKRGGAKQKRAVAD